jgi:hypothetical protein
MSSFLHSLDSSLVARDPFPHIHVEGLIDDTLCRQLAEQVPPVEKYKNGRSFYDDEKLYLNSKRLLSDPDVPDVWKSVVAEHIRPDTYWDFFNLFKSELERESSELADRLANVKSSRVGQRGTGKDLDVFLEAQLVYFMPVQGSSGAERGPHVKTPEKIYGSFLCLRRDNDESRGHDFVVHGIRNGSVPTLGVRNQVDTADVVPVRKFPRKRNRYIGFLNTRRTVTEMTPRSQTASPAVYLNILVALSPSMWQPSRVRGLVSGWRRW